MPCVSSGDLAEWRTNHTDNTCTTNGSECLRAGGMEFPGGTTVRVSAKLSTPDQLLLLCRSWSQLLLCMELVLLLHSDLHSFRRVSLVESSQRVYRHKDVHSDSQQPGEQKWVPNSFTAFVAAALLTFRMTLTVFSPAKRLRFRLETIGRLQVP